jgi:hypothetical protein
MSITSMGARRRQAAQKNDLVVNENNFGMTLISSNKKLPVESLKFNRQYQRATEVARKEKVKQSIIKCGHFLPDQSITVNQDYEVVDGQHRLLAAKDLEISHIPATIYNFSDKEKEAAFFVHINGFDQRLNPVDYWYGRMLSGCPLARFMYFLESDSQSNLRGQIIVKGANSHKNRIPPSMVLEIIILGMGYSHQWTKARDESFVQKIKTMGEGPILFHTNQFVSWYQFIFGIKKENPIAYRRDSFRAICSLYKRLQSSNIAHQKITMQKMKTFPMNAAFVTAPLAGKKYQLINHFNKNRQKNKIPYNLEKE